VEARSSTAYLLIIDWTIRSCDQRRGYYNRKRNERRRDFHCNCVIV